MPTNLEAIGLDCLVNIRVSDARETLVDLGGPVDLVLPDAVFILDRPVLKLLAPYLLTGRPILAQNAFDHDNDYPAYVRNPPNGYLSQPIPISASWGNEFAVVT